MDALTVIDMHTGGEPVRIVTGGYPPIPGHDPREAGLCPRQSRSSAQAADVRAARPLRHVRRAAGASPISPAPISPCCSCTMRAIRPCAATPSSRSAATPSTSGWSRARRAGDRRRHRMPLRAGRSRAVESRRTAEAARSRSKACRPSPSRATKRRTCRATARHVRHRLWRRLLRACRSPRTSASTSAATARATSSMPPTALTETAQGGVPLSHPDHADLAFLYGSILTDGRDGCGRADRQHLRLRRARGRSLADRLRRHRAAGRHACQGTDRHRPDAEVREHHRLALHRFRRAATRAGPHDAIVARVGGRAYYCGRAEFIARGRRRIRSGVPVAVKRIRIAKRPPRPSCADAPSWRPRTAASKG